MNKIISNYYMTAVTPSFIIKQKMEKLERNTDILTEFEHWIQSKNYVNDGCVTVNGYTAEKLAALSEFIDGEGAFMLLIELREAPDRAMRRISNGFVMK